MACLRGKTKQNAIKNQLIQSRLFFKLQSALSSFPHETLIFHRWQIHYGTGLSNLAVSLQLACILTQSVFSCVYALAHTFILCSYAGSPPVCTAMDGTLGNTGHCYHHAPTAGHPGPCHNHHPPPHLLCWPGAHSLPSRCLQCEYSALKGQFTQI